MFQRIMHAPVRPLQRRARRRIGRMLPYALAGATFVVVAAVAIGLLPGRGPGGAPPASALELAARTAAAQPYRVPGPSERWYQRMDTDQKSEDGRFHQVVEVWVGRDGTAWTKGRIDAPGVHKDAPLTRTTWSKLDFVNPMSFKEVQELPADPVALRAALQAATAKLPKDINYTDPIPMLALTALSHPGLRPEQRAALFRLLSTSPGVTATGAATDQRGRPALTIDVLDKDDPNEPDVNGDRVRFYFAKDTSQLISMVFLATDDNIPGVKKGQPFVTVLYDDWKVVPAPKG
jgi:hypothetical protein